MQKEFNHNSFKKAVSNVSGFLSGKDINVPYNTLLDALSLFLGVKNWNTLKEELNEKKEVIIEKDNIITDSLYFDDRVKNFLDFILNNDNFEYFNNALASEKCAYLNFNSLKEGMLSAAKDKVFTEGAYLDGFELKNKDELFMSEEDFECNYSLSDEKVFNLQIAQKGDIQLNSNYLDVLFFLYAIDNKWFEDYVMGNVKYSYIYNKKFNKEVLKISLPIDSFSFEEFQNQWKGMKIFLKLFYKNIKLEFNSENSSNHIQSAAMFTQSALNQISHSTTGIGSLSREAAYDSENKLRVQIGKL